jgi:predicted SAM-dependent methyltransferase
MARLGWDALGVEIDAKAVELATSFKRNVELADIEVLERRYGPEAFDAIMLDHVLEHLHDPVASIRLIVRLIRLPGQLTLATPNVRAPLHQRVRENWIGLDAPRHLVLFSATALTELLKDEGFKQVHRMRSANTARLSYRQSAAVVRGSNLDNQPGPSLAEQIGAARAAVVERVRPAASDEIVITARRA